MEEIVKVEKRGNVEIIRLRKKRKVERNFCAKRIWYKIKAFFHPKAQWITADQAINLLIKEIGNYNYHLLLADEKYRVLPYESMVELINKDDTKQFEWVEDTYDCDNFSLCSAANLSRFTYPLGVCYGELWFCSKSQGYCHAINIFICEKDGNLTVLCAEPQNGQIFSYNKEDWQCLMIKIC